MAPNTRRARVRRTPTPILPEDLVVWEILVRLPAKELLRCRAVCRSWRFRTSTADFLLAHHRHQPSLPLVEFLSQPGRRRKALDAFLDSFDIRRSPAERRPVLRFNNCNNIRGSYRVHASCDGLLVVSLSLNRYYYICNPVTRQWISLPDLTCHSMVLGLYRHGSSDEYRILYWNYGVSNTLCYVLTVGSSMVPRVVGNVEASGLWFVTGVPVMVHDCLHWVHGEGGKVIVFDTVGESFRWMNLPTDQINGTESHLVQINAYTGDDSWTESHLVEIEINGTLGISRINPSRTMMELWILQNYEAEIWLMKYQIKLPVVEMTSIAKCSYFFNGMVLSENGDVLVYCSGRSYLFHCDSTGKLLQKFQWDGVFSEPTRHWFKESLVQHAFFQRKDGRRVKKPSFFQGL